MNKKSGYALRIVLGGYLAYLGVRILTEMIQKRPSNMTLMSVMAVLFIVVGVGYAGNALCKAFDVDIRKLIRKKASEKSKAKKNDTKDAVKEKTVSGNVLPPAFSKDEGKQEKPETTDIKWTENKAAESKTEDKKDSSENIVKEKVEQKETKVIDFFAEVEEKSAGEETAEQRKTTEPDEIELEDEAAISEDAENDFEEK